MTKKYKILLLSLLSLLVLFFAVLQKPLHFWRGVNIQIDEPYNIQLAPVIINTIQLRLKPNKGWDSVLTLADIAVAEAKKLRYKIIISVDGFPESAEYEQTSETFWNSPSDLQEVLDKTEDITKRYAKEDHIVAYQVMSEPVVIINGTAEVPAKWSQLQDNIVKIIQKNTKAKAIVTPAPWGLPNGYKDFIVYPCDDVIYGAHMYWPNSFTHQGIDDKPPQTYPGVINGVLWNKDELRNYLRHTRNFQVQHNVKIYIGEYGCVRWGDGCEQYLKDLTELFKEYEWSYIYFSLNGWHGWNPDYDQDINNNYPVGYVSERWATLKAIYGEKKCW